MENQIAKIKATIYCRVSSREQEETGYSLPAQEKFLREYANRPDNNYKIEKNFLISESASGKIKRKIFHEMIGYVIKSNINIIIVETTDRLTRNFTDVISIDNWINSDENHQIHLVKEGCVLHKNSKSHEWFMWRVKVATAEYYIKLLSENVKKGQKEKTFQGWLPTKPPLGYKTIGEQGHKIHIVDEEVAPFIRQMFTLYSTGNYSTLSLTDKLYKEGFRSRAGGLVVKSKIHKLLTDPFYYGKFMWKNILHVGKHEPIISKDLFNQVQEKLTRISAPYHNKHYKELRGKVFCGDCHKTVTWEKQKGHWYGACKQCKSTLGDGKKYIRQEEVESQLLAHIGSVAPKNDRVMEILNKALRESHSEEIEAYEAREKSINNSLQRIKQRKSNMYDDRLDGRITVEEYDNKLALFSQEEEDLVNALGKLKSDSTEYYYVGNAIHELALRASDIYKSSKATIEERRLLLSYAFSNISISQGKVRPEYTKAFQFLADWMPRLNVVLEPEKEVINKGLKSDFNTLHPVLLPTRVQNLDLSNVVRVFEMLIRWDREANGSL